MENARAEAASLGIARSELYPTLSAVALSGVDREEIPLGTRFYRHTDPAAQVSLDLVWPVFLADLRPVDRDQAALGADADPVLELADLGDASFLPRHCFLS